MLLGRLEILAVIVFFRPPFERGPSLRASKHAKAAISKTESSLGMAIEMMIACFVAPQTTTQ
jgi:hypothetical protein